MEEHRAGADVRILGTALRLIPEAFEDCAPPGAEDRLDPAGHRDTARTTTAKISAVVTPTPLRGMKTGQLLLILIPD